MTRRLHTVELSDRDRLVLAFTGQVGVVTTRQVKRLAFPVGSGSAITTARRCRRSLARLVDHGFLQHLERRIGGVRAGSSSYLYQLGTKGRRAVGLAGRGRTWEPGARFIEHALAVGELHVGLHEAQRAGLLRELDVVHEPATWRRFTGVGGVETLRPDLLVELTTTDGWELRWFIEVDRGTEHLPTVVRKCQAYERYWRSGREADHHEVFPRVLWSVPDQKRADAISGAIGRTRNLTVDLFRLTTATETVKTMTDSTNDMNNTKGGQP